MLKMGVPVHAVAQKMQLEGFDPGVLSGEGEGEIGGGGVGAMPPPPPLIPPVAKPAEDGAEAPVSGGSQAATEVLAEAEGAAEPATEPPVEPAEDTLPLRFKKMLKMGVPAHAVKQKMAMEGIDPSLLDAGGGDTAPRDEPAGVPLPPPPPAALRLVTSGDGSESDSSDGEWD